SSYANPLSAWNLGSETGETSEGIAVSYTSPGTVQLNTGPSIPQPLWNSTPGGNIGQATFSGSLSPSNAFIFFTPGSHFDVNNASWAPTQTASTVSYVLPPGTYTVDAMMSDYTPIQTTATVASGGHAALNFAMQQNSAEGVYAPLFAWNNAQLAAISTGGAGTVAAPYTIVNNPAPGGLNAVFGQFNDYLYPVFPGVLVADTTAYVSLNNPSLLGVTYQSGYSAALQFYGLPLTNNLQFQIVDASHVSIWNARGISGWFFLDDYGPTGFLPLANVVIWGGTQDLVGGSTFASQGSSLVLAGVNASAPTGNIVWGNTFVDSAALTPTMYPGNGAVNGRPFGIFAFESGDLIYNNWVGTTITAYAPNYNMFFGSPQLNAENWNLSLVEPASHVMIFNGYSLTGSIVGGAWQGG
ncbi:thermopsin precursor related protein, partial [mine drainage metagenome]